MPKAICMFLENVDSSLLVEGVENFYFMSDIFDFVKLRSRSRSGEGQVRVRMVRVRFVSGQLKGFTFELKIWT